MTISEESAQESVQPAAGDGWRPLIARLHFYAGVLVAPFLVVAAITGGLYALAPTVERFVYRDILFVDPTGQPLPLRAQAGAARAAVGDLPLTGIRPAATGTDSTRVDFADPGLGADFSRSVFVDPYSGRVLGDEATWYGYLPLSTWLDGLHRHLNLGEPGRIYSEIAASWLWVIALGGLYLWLRGPARRHRRGRAATGRARTRNRHGATGVWLLAGLLFLSATGITWSTYAGGHVSDIRSALDWERPQLNTTPSESQIAPMSIDYDGVLGAAAGAGVRLPAVIAVPEAGGTVTVTEIDKPYRLTTNAVAVDADGRTVTDTVDYWRDYSLVAKLADWGIRAHMGVLFGLLNQLTLLGVAVGLLSVIVGGYRMWWQRRPTRGSDWAVGRPPLRGALRRRSTGARAAVLAGAIAVGWFLPLLGVTLAAFLVVDAAVESIRCSAVPGADPVQ